MSLADRPDLLAVINQTAAQIRTDLHAAGDCTPSHCAFCAEVADIYAPKEAK